MVLQLLELDVVGELAAAQHVVRVRTCRWSLILRIRRLTAILLRNPVCGLLTVRKLRTIRSGLRVIGVLKNLLLWHQCNNEQGKHSKEESSYCPRSCVAILALRDEVTTDREGCPDD